MRQSCRLLKHAPKRVLGCNKRLRYSREQALQGLVQGPSFQLYPARIPYFYSPPKAKRQRASGTLNRAQQERLAAREQAAKLAAAREERRIARHREVISR